VTCLAYEPILRRDPTTNVNMQRWIQQQRQLVARQTKSDLQRRFLEKRGLGDKLKAAQAAKPWHWNHLKPGDVFRGWFEHPDFEGGRRINVELTVTAEGEGKWVAQALEYEGQLQINQDHWISTEAGEQRDNDIAAYVFSKFNMKWRDFDQGYPTAEEVERIGLEGLRMFFKQTSEVEYPEEDEFNKVAADPAKGMTKEEFIKWIKGDNPEYLDVSLPTVFTGRRVRFQDDDVVLDGDFQDTGGMILGYTEYAGTTGGLFSLRLLAKDEKA